MRILAVASEFAGGFLGGFSRVTPRALFPAPSVKLASAISPGDFSDVSGGRPGNPPGGYQRFRPDPTAFPGESPHVGAPRGTPQGPPGEFHPREVNAREAHREMVSGEFPGSPC